MSNGVPAYSHIVVVVEENTNYDEIAGNTAAPYINSLMAGGANLTNFSALTHPSQPNYFALYAGSTFGTTDDSSYTEPDPTLYTILKGAGLTFTGYTETQGDGHDFNHDPWVSFPEGTSAQTDFTSFPALFPGGDYATLPTVSFVIPDDTTNMHSGTIAAGDSWLQANLSGYAQWAKANNSLLVVVWDENDDESGGTVEPSNQVPAILYGANITPGNYNTSYSDYNLLATITDAFESHFHLIFLDALCRITARSEVLLFRAVAHYSQVDNGPGLCGVFLGVLRLRFVGHREILCVGGFGLALETFRDHPI
jgi:acid phosphatase